MPELSPTTKDRILTAAQETFTDYGFRRTSVEDIARTSGLSRTAVYNHFASKERIFYELVESLHEGAYLAAKQAYDSYVAGETPIEETLVALLWSKLGMFYGIVRESKHGGELLDEHGRQAGELAVRSRLRILEVIEQTLRRALRVGDVGRQVMGSPRAGAEMLYLCAHGLQGEGEWKPDAAGYRNSLSQLARSMTAGWKA